MIVLLAALGAACERQEPRSFEHFMDDAIARDGALARCNQSRETAGDDVECMNARRAAEAVAVAEQNAREAALERQSEQTLIAMRDRVAVEQEARVRSEQEARAAADAAYDAQWVDAAADGVPPAPEGIVAFDVYAQRDRRLVPAFDIADAGPPPSDFVLSRPQIELGEATIPRPFRAAADGAAQQ